MTMVILAQILYDYEVEGGGEGGGGDEDEVHIEGILLQH